MATRKKAKRKVKSKARKAPKRKPVARKKAARKAVGRKRAPVRRAKPKTKQPGARRRAAKPAPAGPVVKPPPGLRIGVVTHYYNHLSVAVVKLEIGALRVGDAIHFRGHTTDFGQRVDSLQVNHAAVLSVGPNDDFGIQVREPVREHDVVYRLA